MRRMRTRRREQFHHLCSRRGSVLLTDPLNRKAEAEAVLVAEHGPARTKENAARLEVEFQDVLELGGDPAKLEKSMTCRSVIETGRREKEEEEDDDDSGTDDEEPKPFEQEDDEGDEDQEDEEPWQTQSRRTTTGSAGRSPTGCAATTSSPTTAR
jgi:hypothetical protein